jgi:phosphate/sulfate permease
MENIYAFMVIALAFLAIADLVVGVSNDAVNFLNSAIGSKAVSFKTIMIVASLGVAFGALSSSGMMEVARKGIMNPSMFMFNEIMVIFMAVMITDIILLDFFNTLGMPTSTTVSIVFELLGASVALALFKIYNNDSETISDLGNYINNEKAVQIILGILLSVVVAFSIGAIIQYISRLILSFKFEEKNKWFSSIFSGVAITSISYFILIKGLKGSGILSNEIKMWVSENTIYLILINFVIFTLVSHVITSVLKTNIYKIIIIVGTFALALAFAGNDLVNFIGVPMAAYNSFLDWKASGVAPELFSMASLSKKVETQPYLLALAGMVMVGTLWFSSKAKAVVKTSVDLSRQDDVKERFQPNFLSRYVVRQTINLNNAISVLIPNNKKDWIEKQYEKKSYPDYIKKEDIPAFDMVRASVNLMVASVLISIATSLKLPLSTTYVTFMVAMGTSLADRAWGSESAVYRVAGVLNVIGGWFFTALIAFVASGLIASIININVVIFCPVMLVIAIGFLLRNYINQNKETKIINEEDSLKKAESGTVQGIIYESSENVFKVIGRTNKIYDKTIDALARHDLNKLKKNRKDVEILIDDIDNLKENLYYFIKNLEDSNVIASDFYISALNSLQDLGQALEYIVKISHKHVNNNHKKLKFSQIKELKEVNYFIGDILSISKTVFKNEEFDKIEDILSKKDETNTFIEGKIQIQVERTRSDESSPKNTTLYFNLLLKTKDLMNLTFKLNQEYYNAFDKDVKPLDLKKM